MPDNNLEDESPIKRGKGRPKGSKNKRKGVDELPAEAPNMEAEVISTEAEPEPEKKLPEIKYPANILLVGKRFSGKSTLILNLIDPKNFDNVFVVTVSDHTGNLNSLCRNEMCILNSISDEFIDKLIEIHKENRQMKTLIIFDDFLGANFEPKKSLKMRLLASSGRNFGISVLFSSQDVTGVPTMFRRNVEYLFLGAMNADSIKKITEQYATADMNKKQLDFNLKELAKAKDNSWLFYDDRKGIWEKIEGSRLNPNVLPN